MAGQIILQGEQILCADFALRYYGFPFGPDEDDDQNVGSRPKVSDNSCDQLSDICWQDVPAEDYGDMEAAKPHLWQPHETKDGVTVMDPVRVSVARDSARYILQSVCDFLRNEKHDTRPSVIHGLLMGPRKYVKIRKTTEKEIITQQSLQSLAQYITAQLRETEEDPTQAISSN